MFLIISYNIDMGWDTILTTQTVCTHRWILKQKSHERIVRKQLGLGMI